MKKSEMRVGGLYLAKVSGAVVTVRADRIYQRCGYGATSRDTTCYDVTNLRTGRKTTFRSAAKFRGPATKPTAEEHTTASKIVNALRVGPLGGLTTDPTPAPGAGQTSTSAGVTTPSSEPESYTLDEDGSEVEGEQSRPPTSASVADGHTSSSDTPIVPGARDHATTVNVLDTPAPSLAARIAATRQTREPGTPVAGMVPNDEQEDIIALAITLGAGDVLVVGAGAGTGKTAQLKMLEQILQGRGQYTAFNASLVAESKTKFVKAACNTTHSLAFRAVGKQYAHRLGGERMRSGQIAHILGIAPMQVQVPGQVDADGNPKPKTLSAEFLAGQVLVAIRQFCQSADLEVGLSHIRYIDGIDSNTVTRIENDHIRPCRGSENNGVVKDYLLPYCRKAWADLSRVDGQLPFSHDCYVKIWSLGQGSDRPVIAADYILLDEAQDTAPVFLDVIKRQEHALVVLVGDSNQAIYEWRGAVDAMKAYPDAPRRLLSQSYRFGQAVADVANAILATLEEPTDLVMRGLPTIPSRVAAVEAPRCYLYRTNAGAIGRVMVTIAAGKRPHLIGGGADVVAWMQAALDLQARRGTRHPELCCFETWKEVVEYSKTDEGSDLKLMCKLVEEFGADKIRDSLKDMPKEEDAHVVVSTAHKSKGREWDTVKLGPDFPLANRMEDADRRLLYVAATRAKLTLDITECPAFCGGYDGFGEDAQWVPGLRVAYTRPMPDIDEQDAYLAAQSSPKPEDKAAPVVVPPTPAPKPAPVTVTTDPRYRFGSLNAKWYVVGPAIPDVQRNHMLRVPRRDGSAPLCYIQSVVRRDATVWWYDVTAAPTP